MLLGMLGTLNLRRKDEMMLVARIHPLCSTIALVSSVLVAQVPPEATKVFDEAYARFQMKKFTEALPLYEKAIQLAPQAAEIWTEYGMCLRVINRLPAAARAGWRSVQLDHGAHTEPWNTLGNTLMEARAWEGARYCFEKAAMLNPDREWVAKNHLNLAWRMMHAGEFRGALDLCQKAAQLAPENPVAWIDLGLAIACLDPSQSEEAVKHADKGLVIAIARVDRAAQEFAKAACLRIRERKAAQFGWSESRSFMVLPESLRELPLPEKVERRYSMPDGTTILVTTPEDWAETLGEARPENHFTVKFTPTKGAPFEVLVSPTKIPANPQNLASSTEAVARSILPGALEKELPIHPFGSPTAQGFWILATDAKTSTLGPKEGDFLHILSTTLDTGSIRFVSTALTNDRTTPTVATFLEIFASLRVDPAPNRK